MRGSVECGVDTRGIQLVKITETSKSLGVLRPVNQCGYIRAILTETGLATAWCCMR